MELLAFNAFPTDDQEGRLHTINVDGVDRADVWIGVDDPDPVCKAKKYADGHTVLRAWCGRRWLRGERFLIWHSTWEEGE